MIMKRDKRSPLAKARDNWFESAEGQQMLDATILFSPHHCKYLRNRLEVAFLAGYAAAKKGKR